MEKNVIIKKKYSLIRLFYISILMILPQLGSAQEFYVGAFSIPPSPESSSLIRSVNVPVDKYTGAANIQIPLYTISTQDIQIPISLTYQSSGIKLQDVATWVGLGWNLSAGGRITRVVRHLPDERGYSSQENSHWSQIQNLSGWNRNNFESRLKNMDTEPDVFYFEIPGRSGMFVVDANGVAYTIPYQKLKIEWVGRYSFMLTDEQGVKYTFRTVETTESVVKDGTVTKTISFTSSWYLDKIETVTGNAINYTYTKGNDYEFYNYNKRYILKFHDIGDRKVAIEQQQEQNTLVKIKEPKYLSRISWGNESLVFESTEGRPDIEGARKLTGIKLAVNGNLYWKSILFTYSAFSGPASFSHTALRLDKVEEVAYTGEKRLLNKFQYNVNSLRKRNSSTYDHWGYANFTGGGLTGHPRFTCGVRSSSGGVHFGYLEGESREVDTVCNQFGMLKRIYYTERSFKEFEFESNRALINGYDRFQGGLRIKKIKEYESVSAKPLVTSYYYTNSNGKSSGVAFMNDPYYLYPIYYSYEKMKILGVTQSYTAYYYVAFDQPILLPFDLNGASVGYSEVKEVYPNGSWNIYKFITSNELPDEVHACYDVYSGNSVGTALFTPNSSKYWARGLLKEMRSYNAQGTETYKQEFFYKTDLRAREEITAYIPYYYGENMKIGNADLRIPKIGVYKWISQPVVTSSIKESGTEILSKTTTYTYDPNYLEPKEITLTDAMNTVYRRTITYPFDYSVANADITKVNAYALKIMNQENMINYPIEIIQYKDNKIIGGTINEYKCLEETYGLWDAPVLDKIKELKLTEPVASLNPYVIGVREDPKYKISRYFDTYDKQGKLVQYHDQDGDTVSYIYGSGYLPIAEIYKAGYSKENRKSEVYFQNFEGNVNCDLAWAKSGRKAVQGPYNVFLSILKPGEYQMSYWKSTDGGKTWDKVETPLTIDTFNPEDRVVIGDKSCYIDDIIIAPAKARIKSCGYQSGVGKVSETDYNGNTTYYEYDSFGRLIAIYDNDRNLITRYVYHDATTY